MRFARWFVWLLPVLLMGCFTHKVSFAPANGVTSAFPKSFMLAGADEETNFTLAANGDHYITPGGNSNPAKIYRMAGRNDIFFIETVDLTKSSPTYMTVMIQRETQRRHRLFLESGEPKSRDDLNRLARGILAKSPAPQSLIMSLYDLSKPADVLAAEAWLVRAEARKAAKEAAKSKKAKPKPAAPKPAPKASAPAVSGQFTYSEEVDVISGKLRQYISGRLKGASDGEGPIVRFACHDPFERVTMAVSIDWGEPLNHDLTGQNGEAFARVLIKPGDEAAREWGWLLQGGKTLPPAKQTSQNSVSLDWTTRSLYRAFWQNETVALRGYGASGREITLVYETEGFKKVGAQLRDHCRF